MRRLLIIAAVVAVLAFIISKNFNQQTEALPTAVIGEQATAPAIQHAAVTNMALQAEAKAKQAASIAATDTVAEYEKNQ